MSSEHAPGFEALTRFVEEELDFATSHYNDSYLNRRFSSRLRRTCSDDFEGYLKLVREDPDEQVALLDALSINVTGFFRNPDVWEGIRSVLRTLSDEQERIHVWSTACADGREPYSMAMLGLDDPRTAGDQLSILATDISEPALETAREGVYESSKTIDIGDQLTFLSNYHRYVDQSGDRFEIREPVRRMVTFEHHDLINDGAKSGFDLVVCRNLFIYIDNGYKEEMLETISESLRPGGYLVIGKAETIPPDLKSDFTILDGRMRIYQKS